MQAGQCGNQKGTKFWEVVCDENGIGGGGEYCGDNDSQLGRISLLCHGASGCTYGPRMVLLTSSPGNLVNLYTKAGHEFS
jgi:tubulin beta